MSKLHPITVFAYFMSIIAITAFTMHPVMILISLAGVLLFTVVHDCRLEGKRVLIYILTFAVLSLLNPLFTHNGRTVLFLINGNPITREALMYGMAAAGIIVTVIMWCQCLASFMTTDKTLYLIGRISKKGALIVSMVFRLLPQYRRQAKEIKRTQKALGLFEQESLWGHLMAHLHIFSAMVTWALEHSVDTADSMAARGYGVKRRSQYVSYHLRMEDYGLLFIMALCVVIVIVGSIGGGLAVAYYPEFVLEGNTHITMILYLFYSVLVLLLPLYESKEKIKWMYLNWKK